MPNVINGDSGLVARNKINGSIAKTDLITVSGAVDLDTAPTTAADVAALSFDWRGTGAEALSAATAALEAASFSITNPLNIPGGTSSAMLRGTSDRDQINQIVSEFIGVGRDDAANQVNYGEFRVVIANPDNANPSGRAQIWINHFGTETIFASFQGGSGDIDFFPQGTGNVSLGTITLDADASLGAAQDGYVLTYNNTTGLFEPTAPGASTVTTFADVAVDDFGALGDGATDDTAAFNAAIAASPAGVATIKLTNGRNYIVTIGSLVDGGRQILWVGGGEVNGADVWGLPGIQDSWTDLGRHINNDPNGVEGDFAMYDLRRNANYTGGTGGNLDYIISAATTIASTVGSAGNRKAEKSVLARVDNFSDHANGIASFAAAFAEAQGAVWARENTTHSKVTPTTYAHRSVESNIHGYGADPNRLRRVESIVAHNENLVYSGTPGTDEVGVGLEIYPDSADYGSALKVYTLPGAGTTKGTFLDPVVDVDINSGQYAQVYTGTDAAHTIHGCDLNTANAIVVQRSNQGGNSVGGKHTYSQTRTVINDPTDGTEDGTYQIYVSRAGALVRVASFIGINGEIELTPQGTGNVTLGTLEFDADATLGATEDGYSLTYDNASGEFRPALKVGSDPSAVTGADAITNMMSLTQAEYDAIGTPDANTFYVITS